MPRCFEIFVGGRIESYPLTVTYTKWENGYAVGVEENNLTNATTPVRVVIVGSNFKGD